jgi:hypothetical protein
VEKAEDGGECVEGGGFCRVIGLWGYGLPKTTNPYFLRHCEASGTYKGGESPGNIAFYNGAGPWQSLAEKTGYKGYRVIGLSG